MRALERVLKRARGPLAALARLAALAGGLVLVALVGLICVSVLTRALGTLGNAHATETALPALAAWMAATFGPVPGDFELVEAGIAFAIFAFLPLCQLHGGHATVDLFTDRLPGRGSAWLVAFWEIALALALVLIAVQLGEGLRGKWRTGETTFLLQFPVWWAYAASLAAATVAALVGLYCALARVAEAATGASLLPREVEGDR